MKNINELSESDRFLVSNNNFINSQNYIMSDLMKYDIYENLFKIRSGEKFILYILLYVPIISFFLGVINLEFKLIYISEDLTVGIIILIIFILVFGYFFYRKIPYLIYKSKYMNGRFCIPIFIFIKNIKNKSYKYIKEDFISLKK